MHTESCFHSSLTGNRSLLILVLHSQDVNGEYHAFARAPTSADLLNPHNSKNKLTFITNYVWLTSTTYARAQKDQRRGEYQYLLLFATDDIPQIIATANPKMIAVVVQSIFIL